MPIFTNLYYFVIGMTATNYERIIIGVVALVGITILGSLKIVASEAIVGVYSAVIGFMLGHSTGSKAEQLKNNKEIK